MQNASVSELHEQASKLSALIDHHRTEVARLQGQYNLLLLTILRHNSTDLTPPSEPQFTQITPAEGTPEPKLPSAPASPQQDQKKPQKLRKTKPTSIPPTQIPEQPTAASTPAPVALPQPPESPIIPKPRRRFTTKERTNAIIEAVAPYGTQGLKVHKIAAQIGDIEHLITLWYNKFGKNIKGISKPKSGYIAFNPPAGFVFPTAETPTQSPTHQNPGEWELPTDFSAQPPLSSPATQSYQLPTTPPVPTPEPQEQVNSTPLTSAHQTGTLTVDPVDHPQDSTIERFPEEPSFEPSYSSQHPEE
jgi:hypothetical protein